MAKKDTLEEYIIKARAKHGDKYDYSLIPENFTRQKYLSIICPEHGEFLQRCDKHLFGQGCPLCNTSKAELKIKEYLDRLNISYIWQFKELINPKTLCYLPFDFLFARS